MLTKDLSNLPATRPLRLRNVICPYCGCELTKQNTTKEHVIGRKFVPKSTLENQWNLILNACRDCNNRKSGLEDDISAITMQPDVTGKHFGSHPQLALDSAHKRKRTHSRYTGKLVGDSQPTLQIKYELGPDIALTFHMTAQAQIAEERASDLAMRHFQGFFFFITYNHDENRGWWWKGKYAQILAVSKTDWGNPLAVTFMEKTRDWHYRVLAITADEHFKLAIRKHPTDDIWSLAVEWNENYRVLAACGDEDPLKAFLSTLPRLEMQTLFQSEDSGLAVRTEKALSPEEDMLFTPILATAPDAPPVTPDANAPSDAQ